MTEAGVSTRKPSGISIQGQKTTEFDEYNVPGERLAMFKLASNHLFHPLNNRSFCEVLKIGVPDNHPNADCRFSEIKYLPTGKV